MPKQLILKGDICYTPDKDHLVEKEQCYLVVLDRKVEGVYEELPERFDGIPVTDCKDALILPGMTDLHTHAPQYSYTGLGMDLELLDWLAVHTFPEEAHYRDEAYAEAAYREFVRHLKASETTRAVIFGTVHVPATMRLMELLEESGLVTFVGKVNMDRNGPENLIERSPEEAEQSVREWLSLCQGRFQRTKPILTPRFTPSCTDELMERLGRIREEYDLLVQSHLSENRSEIAWVKELCPWSSCYADTYQHWGLLTGAVMAHCVSSPEEEIQLLKDEKVVVAHCPQSNMNIASGIAPIRRYLEEGISVGLGTDVAGGASLSMFRCIADTVGVSKLRWRLEDENLKPLTFEQAFWLATKGGGAYFGRVGSFEPGYEADILVIREEEAVNTHPLLRRYTPAERLARIVYRPEMRWKLEAKYVCGRKI